MGVGRRQAVGAWLLAALVAGCAEPEPAEWTWVADGWGGFPRIEPVGREELVVVRSPGRAVSIDLLDVEGRRIWSRRIGGVDATVYAYGLAVGGDRTIYVGGWFKGVVTFGDEPRALTSHLCDRWGQGVPVYCEDGFVAAYAEDGQLRWVRRSGELQVDGDVVQPPPDTTGVFVRRGDPFAGDQK